MWPVTPIVPTTAGFEPVQNAVMVKNVFAISVRRPRDAILYIKRAEADGAPTGNLPEITNLYLSEKIVVELTRHGNNNQASFYSKQIVVHNKCIIRTTVVIAIAIVIDFTFLVSNYILRGDTVGITVLVAGAVACFLVDNALLFSTLRSFSFLCRNCLDVFHNENLRGQNMIRIKVSDKVLDQTPS
jgi:hypothetical protein